MVMMMVVVQAGAGVELYVRIGGRSIDGGATAAAAAGHGTSKVMMMMLCG